MYSTGNDLIVEALFQIHPLKLDYYTVCPNKKETCFISEIDVSPLSHKF